MHSIATKQLNSITQDEVGYNLLGALSALTVAPAIFKFTRNTVHGLVTTPIRIYNGTWGSDTIGDQVNPGFSKCLNRSCLGE